MMMKKIAVFYILIFSSPILFSNQSLVISTVKSDIIDESSSRYIEIELISLFSQMLDMDVFREGESNDSFRYFFNSEIIANDDLYNLNYEFLDLKNNIDIITGTIIGSNINGLSENLLEEVTKIRAFLRKPPGTKENEQCFLVVGADVPEIDIYINGEYKGVTPVSITGSIGDEILIEGRTETQKKAQLFKFESAELIEVKLELEPITGSLLLKGDALGRTLVVNGQTYEIENSSLLRDLPIGKVNLSMECEWGIWSDSVFIEEEELTEVKVEFEPISRVDITVNYGITLNIINSLNNELLELFYSDIIILEPGEYNFVSSQEGYIPNSTKLTIDPGYLYEFITPELELIHSVKEELSVKSKLRTKQFINNLSFWSAVGSGILLTAGIILEAVSVNLYESSSVTEDVVGYRETGKNLRIANITLVSTGVLSLISYFFSGNSK